MRAFLVKHSNPDFLTIALIAIGAVLMIAAFLAPAQSTRIVFSPPGLSLLVEASSSGLVITGTNTDAAVLEFAFGLALAIYGLYRHYH